MHSYSMKSAAADANFYVGLSKRVRFVALLTEPPREGARAGASAPCLSPRELSGEHWVRKETNQPIKKWGADSRKAGAPGVRSEGSGRSPSFPSPMQMRAVMPFAGGSEYVTFSLANVSWPCLFRRVASLSFARALGAPLGSLRGATPSLSGAKGRVGRRAADRNDRSTGARCPGKCRILFRLCRLHLPERRRGARRRGRKRAA